MNKRIPPGGPEARRFRKAVNDALEMLGENSSRALLFHLKEKYGIDIESGNVALADLQSALSDLLGPGAEVIMGAIRRNLGS